MGASSASSKPKPPKLAFIISNSPGKPDPKARRLIRSHVMLEKNRKKTSGQRGTRSWINEESGQRAQPPSSLVPTYFPLAKQLGGDLTLTKFAYDMPPYALELVFKFFTLVQKTMYPIEVCVMFDMKHSIWFEYLQLDDLYCHSVLCTTQAYFDWLTGTKRSMVQLRHAQQTLALLQQRLLDSHLAISDITIAVVVNLMMVAALVHDYESTKRHMVGLHRMVELRGGVGAFKHNSQIQLKTCRADLTVAMITGNKPMFFPADISSEPYIARPQSSPYASLPKHIKVTDEKLCNIWADLREFNRCANLAFQTGQRMDCILFQEILISVEYRLLLVEVDTSPFLDQIVHIGMLAYATGIFLQVQGLAIKFEQLSTRLQDCMSRFQHHDDAITGKLKIWLVFVACMSTADIASGALHAGIATTLKALNLVTWDSLRELFKDYLWIDVLHNTSGRAIFNMLTATPLLMADSDHEVSHSIITHMPKGGHLATFAQPKKSTLKVYAHIGD